MSAARERDEFSRRLNQKLRDRGVEPINPTRLAKGFNDRYPELEITVQAARKWLGAEAIPQQARLRALAEWLEVEAEWLRYGDPGHGRTARQPAARYQTALSEQELIRRYRRLRSDQQAAVAEIITALSERKPQD